MDNYLVLCGKLADKPLTKKNSNGKGENTSFQLRMKKGENSEFRVWARSFKTLDACIKEAQKDDEVCIMGRLDSYQQDINGKKCTFLSVVAEEVWVKCRIEQPQSQPVGDDEIPFDQWS